MKKFLFYFFIFLFVENVANSKQVSTTIDDGHQIREIKLIVEDIFKCLTEEQIISEVKYNFYNSTIKLNENSPYRLYLNVNLGNINNGNVCVGNISTTIYSYTRSKPIKKIEHWTTATIVSSGKPWETYFLDIIGSQTKKAIVWMNEN